IIYQPDILWPVPVDVAAEVMANQRLAADFNELTLSAPAIAGAAAPGQFVMVKAGSGHDPLLRRPFSIFRVLREHDGTATALTIFNKRVGSATRLLYDAKPGHHVSCLGPLGRPWPVLDGSNGCE